MQLENVPSNAVTYVCSLKACSGSAWLVDKGRKIYGNIVKEILDTDLQVSNILIDMYIKFTSFEEVK